VLATGGILGGGIIVVNNGYAQETIFGLPIITPEQPSEWFQQEFLSTLGHPIHRSGVCVDATFHPVGQMDGVIYQNLFVVGSTLANCDPIRERSLEGIALATAFKVGEAIAGDNVL
jgi:glycerol-3-phosphate dehydrogenase subunit B